MGPFGAGRRGGGQRGRRGLGGGVPVPGGQARWGPGPAGEGGAAARHGGKLIHHPLGNAFHPPGGGQDLADAAWAAEYLFLGAKPDGVPALLEELGPQLRDRHRVGEDKVAHPLF